jgi:3-oxoacyl-(acyl-carrier-protein) synthase
LALVGFRDLIDCGSSGVLARLLVAASPTYMRCVRGCDFDGAASRKERSTQARRTASQRLATGATAPQGRPTIVITGQGCLLPGGANSPAALHQTLQQQRSGIEDLRQSDPQWEADFFSAQLQPDRATSGLSGRVREADLSPSPDLDPRWFESLSRPQQIFALAVQQCRAALADDPEVLCLIGATADGFEDQDRVAALRFAGIDPQSPGIRSALAEKAGALLSPYEALLVVLQKLLPGRVRLRLLDAACASSLYAVAQGMSALENRQARVVLVGGVYCPGPGNNCLFSQFKGLTDSECRPFDAQASGVVFAEGAAMLVMRRAEDCSHSDEPPLAIVRGVGLSSDGRSPSANVPKSAGQILALQRCYENYKIDPASISAIEGHGTATPTGDATEVRTLANFFASHVSAPIPLHSMKGLIGHTGWAAGTAAIVAAVQALTRQRLPGQANWSQPSPAIVAASQVLTVSPNPTPLPLDKRRIAVDGFGFGGANAHVVIEPWGTDHPKLVEANPSPQTSAESRAVAQSDDELVVVADYSLGTAENARACALPADMVVLPDLVDEMDDSQRMAVALTHGVLQQLAGFDEADRRETSIVLALAGKTQRACEATLRILGPRLARHLPTDIAARLMGKFAQSRPSGPYTLQCMMPNVAAGRAALLLNLNGPNYVIDAGPESADALVEAAQWLLRAGSKAGTRLVVLGQLPSFSALGITEGDFAEPSEPQRCTAIGVTTRALAQARGWKIVRAVGASPAEFAGTTVPLEPSGSGRRTSPMRWVQSNCRTTSPQRPAQGLSPRPANVSASVPVSVIAVPSQQWSMLQADGGPLLDAAALVVLLGPSCHGRIPVNGRSVAEFQAAAMGSVDNVRRRLASLSAFELISWQRVSPDWDAAGFQRELGLLHDVASQTQVDGTDKLVGIWSVMGNVPIGGETEAGERFQSLLAAGRPRPVPCRLLLSSAGEFATVLRQWQRERGEFAEFATWYRGAERYVGRSLATREKSAWELPELPASVPAHAAALWEFPFHLDDWGIVDFHQARGVPTIPGAWIIDQMVACVLQAAGVTAREVEIENVRFLKFAKALPSLQTDYRILIAAADAGFHAWLLGNITNPQGLVLKRDEVFATATLRPKSGSSMRSLTPASNQAGSFERRVRDPYCNRRESIQLSGPFDCLEQIEIGGHGRRARFNPKVERAWRETVPALAIDAAIRVAGMHVAEQGLHVPTSISRLVVPVGLSGWTLADADWQIVAGHPRSDGREIYCGPVNVVDGDGRVRATIEGAVVSQLS